MKSLVENLTLYAQHHRDKRNIATHFIGIPMIVVGTQSLLARIGIGPVNAAVGATAAASWYYRKLDPDFGKVMAGILGASCALATTMAMMPLPLWAGMSIGLFVGGWAIQFFGHKLEGKKPAFLEDLKQLLIGPLFLVAEAAFALGLAKDLKNEIERLAGPTHWGKAIDIGGTMEPARAVG